MEIFTYITPLIYALLVLAWSYILVFYIRKLVKGNITDTLLKTLLIILAVDAFRTLFESSFFGIWFTSLAGFIPIDFYNMLAKPEIVFYPKILNLIATCIILVILIRKWIPEETSRLANIESIVQKQTIALQQNLDQLKKTKDRLLASEEKYKNAFDFFPFEVYVFTCVENQFNLAFANRTVLFKTNQKIEALLGTNITDFWKAYPELNRYLRKCFDTKKTVAVEYPMRNSLNNKTEYFSITFSFLPPSNVQVILVDITDQKIAENELTAQRSLFETMFNTIPDGVVITNTHREILVANKAIKNTFGYTPEELIGKTTELLYDSVENYQRTGAVLFNKNAVNPDNLYITNYKKKDNTLFPGETYGTKLYDKNGNWIGNLGVIRDISERIHFIDTLEKAKVKAEESDRLKSAFLANMSHEIRTPLNSILGFSELLCDDRIAAVKKQKFIKLINSNGEQLTTIISDIIDISKIESNQVDIHKKYININDELDELKDWLLSKLNESPSHKLKISTKYALERDESMLLTDKVRFRQILQNLLGNALKFTQEGEISFGYTIKEHTITFFVTDTGIGISPENQLKLFKRFSQIDPKDSNKVYRGAGIGLAISKGLTEMLGGKIGVKSEEDKGSTFYVELPYESPNEIKYQLKTIAAETQRNFNFKTKTILIVDDEFSNNMLLETILSEANATTLAAYNGREAIELVKKNKQIDLILMDLEMPHLNGYQATPILKKMRPTLPIIAQTAHILGDESKRALAAGCSAVITKPIKKQVLLATLHTYLFEV